MAPSIPSAKTTLSYPLYGVDFDPHNDKYLITGGGGGEVRSGVGNKIVRSPVPMGDSARSRILALDPPRRLVKKRALRSHGHRAVSR